MSQRDELATRLAVVAVLAQLIFAQITLATVVCLVIAGKVSRWRPLWLALPAAAGVAWLLAIGVRPAVSGYLACGARLFGLLTRHDTLGEKAKDLSRMLAGWRHWLPGQLPIALIVAPVQAAIGPRPGRTRAGAPRRSGLLAAARSGYLAATLRRGELATYDGCCLGIVPGTGKRAAISWQEAQAGVLCSGQDAAAVSATGRDLALAAIQHRKSVVIIDLVGDPEYGATRRRYRSLADFIESECAAVGAPLRRLGWRSAHYDPISSASPARATSLTMAMIDWTGVGHARQLFCANYLNAVSALLASSRADQAGSAGSSGTVLDELVKLMTPGALRAGLVQLRDRQLAAGSLAARVAELSRQLDAEPTILAPVALQLAELSSAGLAQLIRPAPDATAPDATAISVAAGIARREVALFPLDRLVLGGPAVMLARLVVADLIETLAERSDLGGRSDCLVWINGCEAIDQRQLAVLAALGEGTGTAVVLGTALGSASARIASEVNVVAVRGTSPVGLTAPPLGQAALAPGTAAVPTPIHADLASVLAEIHAPGCPDTLTFAVRRPRPRLVAGCRVVR